MSYTDILLEIGRFHTQTEEDLLQEKNHRMLNEIVENIPNKKILLTQILFALDQIYELIHLTLNHNKLTGLHLGRVGRLGALLAKKADLHWKERLECLYGGWIHDVGKMYIHENILEKPSKLTPEEFSLIKLHVQFGCEILKYYPHLEPYLNPVQFHHERWDGNGYPYKLGQKEIPETGRLICIVDAYDAMTACRPYPPYKRTHEEAMVEIERCLGTHFDPRLGELFLSCSKEEIEDTI